MKLTITFGLLFFSLISFGQTKTDATNNLYTNKYSGFYSYGNDIEKRRIGSISIYPETDSTILFRIDLNRGAPSYNMGSLYGRVKTARDTGIFYTTKDDYEGKGCKWIFYFTKNKLKIKTVNEENNCGFGHAVYADGEFKRKSNKYEDFFEDMEGKKIYFKVTSPEEYYKDQ